MFPHRFQMSDPSSLPEAPGPVAFVALALPALPGFVPAAGVWQVYQAAAEMARAQLAARRRARMISFSLN